MAENSVKLLEILPIMGHLEEGILSTDDDFRITYLNRSAQQIFGVQTSRAIGKTIDEVIVIENFQTVFDEILRTVDSRQAWQGEMICVGTDGRKILLDCSVMRVSLTEDGKPGLLLRTRETADQKPEGETDREPQRLYRDMVELANDGICIVQNMRLIYANLQLAGILGCTVRDLLGSPLKQHISSEHFAGIMDLYEKHLSGEKELGAIETVLVSSSGSEVPVEITGSLIAFEGGKASLLVIRDISKRMRAEEALRQSEERYRKLVENVNDIIYKTDIRGYFTYVNPVAVRLIKYSREEILGKHYLEIIRSDFRERMDAFYVKQFKNKIPSTYLEFPVIDKQGGEIWLGQNLQLEIEDGKVTGFQAIARDVTERKRAEAALRESEETARALLNAPSEMAVLLDSDGIILGLNDYAAFSIDKKPSELIGVCGFDLMPPGLKNAVKKLFGKVVRSGQPKRFEEEYSGHWFDVSMYPVSSEQGKVTRLAICAREITKQKKAEEKLLQALRQAQEADLLKSQFLANMSHEIRTPLNAITGLTTLLMLQPDLDEEKRKGYLKNVKHSAESLLAMINAILGLAKIESGTMGPNPVEFHFHDFIESLRNRYQQQMEAKRLRFFLDMQPDVPESLIGDPVLLEQVINNLLGNAYKFTEQGSVRLGVTVSRRKKETLTLQFEVHDTGIGIPPEQQDKVFQAFFQVDGSTTREQQGTGLGLSIARESVRLMGGKIWMESRPKVGTTFFFTCTMKMPRPPAAK